MAVLLAYPVFLKKISGPGPGQQLHEEVQKETAESGANPQPLQPALTSPEGPFLEMAAAPSVIPFENDLYEVKFSTLGASIVYLKYTGQNEKLGLTQTLFYEGDPNLSGLFGIRLLHEQVDLTQAQFRLYHHSAQDREFTFVYEKTGEYRLIKQFEFPDQKPVIRLDVSIENLSPREKHFPLEFFYAFDTQGQTQQSQPEVLIFEDKIRSENLGKISKKGFQVYGQIQWAGLLKKYFALLVKPDWKIIAQDAYFKDPALWSQLRLEPLSLASGEKVTKGFVIYAGPQHYETLREFDVDFENILSRGFFGIFKIWLLIALKFLDQFSHNFGWAIILLTFALKGVFTPLTHMSYESMRKMQALQPKLKSLQERYKKDPTKLNQEMMQLYRRNRVNPMSGCLPMLLQVPIFIAFYQVLNETIEIKGAPFIFWIQDLSEPDRLFKFPFSIPLIGDSFNLLPLLMLGSMVWQQQLTPQTGATPEQTKMMAFMPLIFGFLFYQMPSGLVLYWFVNNVLTIIHQVFIKKMVVVLHHEDRE